MVFTLNGQRHGEIRSEILARRLNLDYIVDDILLVVDVTSMPSGLREDIWMTSRDRVADTAEKRQIEDEIFTMLDEHQALRELNNRRKQQWVTQKVEEDEPLDILQDLISEDPALAEVFGVGTELRKLCPGPGLDLLKNSSRAGSRLSSDSRSRSQLRTVRLTVRVGWNLSPTQPTTTFRAAATRDFGGRPSFDGQRIQPLQWGLFSTG